MARISEFMNKITHITFTNVNDFLDALPPHCVGKIVNDIIMDSCYIYSILDEPANMYYRLVLKSFAEHGEALRRIVKNGYIVVVI